MRLVVGDPDGAAGGLCAFGEVAQSAAAVLVADADAVVGDPRDDLLTVGVDLDCDFGGLCVADDVGQ
ncbi:hypothetical protein OHA18_37845 [Kribbella sp. NBC_00709]|nr:hypothetical protein [Kribbella sp. NBC_00709]